MWSILRPAHPQVCHAPEDPTKEGIEQRAHKREEVCKEGNDLCDDEGKGPSCCQYSCPGSPADDGVAALMARAFEDTEEDEAGGDRGVKDAEEDQSRYHERERDFLVHIVTERSKGGRSIVLCASVCVDDCV